MLQAGSVVTAVLGTNEEGAQRTHFGSLKANELYRVASIVKGNNGEVSKVSLAGERSWWPASFFAEMGEEEIEAMRVKVKEAEGMGARMHPKLVRALEVV